MENPSDLKASNIREHLTHTEFTVNGISAKINLLGRHNVYNALAAVAVCKQYGIENEKIAAALEKARVKGRNELMNVPSDFAVIIDYAHNELSTENLFEALKLYRPERIITVFG